MILRPLVGDPEMTVDQNRWHLRSAMGLGKDESIEQTLADLTSPEFTEGRRCGGRGRSWREICRGPT